MSESAGNDHDRDFERLLDENQEFVAKLRRHHSVQENLDGRSEPANVATLGEYTLGRTIGRGGMGVVYEARQASMDRSVALKVLPGGLLADLKAVARFEREAKIAGQLQHPNIVAVHGMGVDENTPYFVMELVEGETLASVLDWLRDGSGLDPEDLTLADWCRVAEVFVGVADGLEHAHARRIVHRDIKPSNLIFEGLGGQRGFFLSGRLRILDFGLAQLEGQESLTASGDLVGTPLYMSPEQAKRRKIEVDHRTDLYSLGATMYEVLTRRPPFRGRNHSDTLEQIIVRDAVQPRQINPRIPRNLETIVLKCLRKDPADRYGTAGALARDLERFVRGDPIEARPQSPWERLAGRLRRHRVKVSVTAAVGFLIVLAMVFALRAHRAELLGRESKYEPAVMAALMKLHQGDAVGGERASKEVGFYFPFIHPAYASFRSSNLNRGDGPVAEAIKEFSAAAASVPGRADAYWHRARAHVLLGNEEAALKDLDLALTRNPELVPAAFLKAFLLEESSGDSQTAQAIRDRAKATAPAWALSWLEAQHALRINRPAQTAARFRELLEALPADTEPYIGARLEARLGLAVAFAYDERAYALLQEVAILRNDWPDSAQAAILEIYACYMVGIDADNDEKKDESEAMLEIACDDFGDQIVFPAMDIYFRHQDLDRVERWLDRFEPPSFRKLFRAKLLNILGERRAAVTMLRGLVELEPENIFVLEELARQLGRTRESLGLIRKACMLAPKNAEVRAELASKLAFLSEKEEARRECQLAMDLGPRTSWAWYRIARAFIEIDEIEQGQELFDVALKMEPSYDVYNNIARYYASDKQWRKCIDLYDGALAQNRRFSWALSNKGHALEKLGHEKDAIECYTRAMTGWPSSANSHVSLARILESGGDFRGAIDMLLSGLEIVPGSWPARSALNRLLGDETAAAAANPNRLAESLLEFEPSSRRPDVGDDLLSTMAVIRKALHPVLVSYTSIDAAFDAAVPVVDANAEWRFFRGRREPPPEWRRENFDDSGWELGPSGFGFLSEGAPATHLEDMKESYTSLYLRRSFELPDPEDWEAIILELDLDDGVVAYLNGVEISRVGAGEVGSSLGFDAVASNSMPNRAVIAIDARAIAPGQNVLALHGLNRSLSEGDYFLIEPALFVRPRPGSARDRERFSAFLAESQDSPNEESDRRLVYCEGRLHQRSGDFKAAAAKFRGLVDRDPESREPLLRLAESLRSLGEASDAEETLRGYLARSQLGSRELWSLWASIGLADLERTPGELLASELLASDLLETGETKTNRRARMPAQELRWLLERLQRRDPVRINCGGIEYRGTSAGESGESGESVQAWGRDCFFDGGNQSKGPREWNVEVKGSDDDPLYCSNRYFRGRRSGYHIPLPPGSYRVTLHNSETFFPEIRAQRVFDVLLEGEIVLESHEPLSHGWVTAYEEGFDVEVHDGLLDIEFLRRIQNPQICAIEIRRKE